MKNADVRRAIEERRAELLNKMELSTEAVLREVARVCFFDIGKCYDAKGKIKPIHNMDDDTRRALAGIKDGEIQSFNKNQALRNAMHHLNLLPSRSSVSVSATAQSAAAAEVSQTQPEQRSKLEIARRVAFLLAEGAAEAEKGATPTKPRQSQAA